MGSINLENSLMIFIYFSSAILKKIIYSYLFNSHIANKIFHFDPHTYKIIDIIGLINRKLYII